MKFLSNNFVQFPNSMGKKTLDASAAATVVYFVLFTNRKKKHCSFPKKKLLNFLIHFFVYDVYSLKITTIHSGSCKFPVIPISSSKKITAT